MNWSRASLLSSDSASEPDPWPSVAVWKVATVEIDSWLRVRRWGERADSGNAGTAGGGEAGLVVSTESSELTLVLRFSRVYVPMAL